PSHRTASRGPPAPQDHPDTDGNPLFHSRDDARNVGRISYSSLASFGQAPYGCAVLQRMAGTATALPQRCPLQRHGLPEGENP
uniref:hypothetical protein n=1 Tax=uncultured Bilophila sp. TaxID=529385 RepID=UPI00260D8DB4